MSTNRACAAVLTAMALMATNAEATTPGSIGSKNLGLPVAAHRGVDLEPGSGYVVYLGDANGTPIQMLFAGTVPQLGRPDVSIHVDRRALRDFGLYLRTRQETFRIAEQQVDVPDAVGKPQWTVGRLHPYIHSQAPDGAATLGGSTFDGMASSARSSRLSLTAGGSQENASSGSAKGGYKGGGASLGGSDADLASDLRADDVSGDKVARPVFERDADDGKDARNMRPVDKIDIDVATGDGSLGQGPTLNVSDQGLSLTSD